VTRQEFDRWIEGHYTELLAVASRRTRCEPVDVLHAAVAGMLASPDLVNVVLDPKATTQMGVWPWAVSWVRGKVSDARKSARRQARVQAEVASVVCLGAGGNLRTPPKPSSDHPERDSSNFRQAAV